MVAKRAKGKRAARRPAAARQLVVMVSDFQRQRLIEDAAYFRAEHFRRVEPGRYREQDRSAAEAEIEMVLRGCRITRCS